MEKDFYFLIAIHFHQPIGNFDYVIERACKRCYRPFLETIAEFPNIKFNLHFSGCLLEWFKQHNPGILGKIKRFAHKGQVELLSGGFYEPILPVLSKEDAIEQIEMLSGFINDEFGITASGAWLPERVWEPAVAEVFSKAGIRYTVVDDTHLRYAGLNQSQLYGYYITEDKNNSVYIFPSDKFLRYGIPFHPQQEAIDYFRKIRDEFGKGCVLYSDDGEKFGEWPGTNEWVYEKRWLYDFLKVLTENSSWLKTEKISDYMKDNTPQAMVYLPAASYEEMNEWTLPQEAQERLEEIIGDLKQQGQLERYIDFLRGGFWRNFFVKYPESNQMHKRTMLVSERLRNLIDRSNGEKADELQDAKKVLFRSQCNCAYWHGVFGGLYLYHLRSSVYKNIIAAEQIADSVEYTDKTWITIDEKDFDCDGATEFIVNTPHSSFIIDSEGATLIEWDIKDRLLNILNTLSRKKEAYHRKLRQIVLEKAKIKKGPSTIHEAHIANSDIANKELFYDNFRRVTFLDHFVLGGTTLDEFANSLYYEQGDFLKGDYHKVSIEKKQIPSIELERKGLVGQKQVTIKKQFIFYQQEDKLGLRYEITNLSLQPLNIDFAPELNFSLTQDDTKQELSLVSSLSLYDKVENLKLNIKFSEKAKRVFRFCVYTVSQSERDVEENYQASCVLPIFDIALAKDKTKRLEIEMEVRHDEVHKKDTLKYKRQKKDVFK